MFKLIFIIKCLSILVTSNSFQGFQTYPQVAYQQNYVNHDQPIMTQMVDGYPQLLLQNTWPSYQNVPLTYQDTSKGYYNNFLLNSAPNTFLDANARIYDQNGFDIMQYISSPRDVNPNVLSNYVTIPQTYLKNQCVDNERQLYFPSELTVTTQGNQHFRKTNDIRSSINYNPNCNGPSQNIDRKSKNNNKKRKSCQSKRARNREENQEKPVKCKSSLKNNKRKNNLRDNNDEEQNNKCINNANNNSMLKKNINENNILDKKSKANQRSKYKDQSTTDETVHIRDTGCQSKILSEDNCECLDINENCVELENRRTRNNYNVNPVQSFQQFPNMPNEFNNNIASYINSFMPNQNFNTDLFTANGNFPFNFDYMNQMPQSSNSNQNGSEKKRRNRRRKKKPKNNRTSTNDNDRSSKNNNENSNKNQQIEDNRDKVVELLPNKPVEIKLKTKLIPAEPVQIDDIVPDKKLTKVNIEEEILPDKVDENPIEVILEPTSIIIDDTHDKNLQLPVSQEYTLNVYDNDIFDDYYPDFTSDNIYLSREDQDFHDRHYYSADNKAGINRERRKYEPSARQNHKINRIDTLVSDESVDNSIKKVKKIASKEEVKFKTPPGLDFPDFKTEMINKDKYSLRSDINYPSNKYQNKQSDKVSSFSRVKSIEPNPEKNIDNAVETIFARTKVAKYGVPETDEKTNKSFGEFNVTDKSTNDEKTTIVLAKSLNYPVGYK